MTVLISPCKSLTITEMNIPSHKWPKQSEAKGNLRKVPPLPPLLLCPNRQASAWIGAVVMAVACCGQSGETNHYHSFTCLFLPASSKQHLAFLLASLDFDVVNGVCSVSFPANGGNLPIQTCVTKQKHTTKIIQNQHVYHLLISNCELQEVSTCIDVLAPE